MFRILQQFILATLFATFASQSSAMFIQADWFDPTEPGVGTNRYSYSLNDPVNKLDPLGNQTADPLEDFVDPDFEIFDPLLGGTNLGAAPSQKHIEIIQKTLDAVVVGVGLADVVHSRPQETKTQNESKPIQDVSAGTTVKAESSQQGTTIYRLGSVTNTNLTPRPVDITGLSFLLSPPSKGKYGVTTIEAVNSTGALVAIQDGANYVSVVPSNPALMEQWIASRPTAEIQPHLLTEVLRTIVVRPPR